MGHIIILNLFALNNFSDIEKVTDLMSRGEVDNTMASWENLTDLS